MRKSTKTKDPAALEAAPKRSTGPRIPVVEIFGPTIQGEGLLIGRQTHFVRLGGCDYRCVWCDSLHAVIPSEVRKNSVFMNADEIVKELQDRRKAPYVTISGGNPALHQLGGFIAKLRHAGFRSVIETQGTKKPYWMSDVDTVVVSPKPPSSGMTTDWKMLDEYMKLGQSHLKIVVFNDEDYAYASHVRTLYPEKMMFLSVGNNVGFDGPIELLDKLNWLTGKLLTDSYMSDVIPLPQLHVLLWGNRQGV